MCGRATFLLDQEITEEILREVFHIEDIPSIKTPSYNLSPGNNLLSIIEHKGHKRAGYISWGYPTNHLNLADKNKGYSRPIINIRSETIDEKPLFKDSFKSKRCIILVDSFYEWQRKKGKTPYRFILKNSSYMPLAGLYKSSMSPNGKKTNHLVILTCPPNDMMSEIHDRMPVILSQQNINTWLSKKEKPDTLKQMLLPYPSHLMDLYEFSSDVNNTKNDSEKCILPAPSQQSFL